MGSLLSLSVHRIREEGPLTEESMWVVVECILDTHWWSFGGVLVIMWSPKIMHLLPFTCTFDWFFVHFLVSGFTLLVNLT